MPPCSCSLAPTPLHLIHLFDCEGQEGLGKIVDDCGRTDCRRTVTAQGGGPMPSTPFEAIRTLNVVNCPA